MKKRFFLNFGLAFLVFTVIAVFFSSESYFFYLLKGKQPDFWKDFGWKMVRWIPWAFFTPTIISLVRWFPFDRKRWFVSVPVHLTSSLFFSFIQSSFFYFYSQVYELSWCICWGPLMEYFIKFFHLNFLTYLVTIVVCYLFDYYRKQREHELKTSKLQEQLTQAQLEVLKMQLHPHFLFNTLHAISALITKDPDKAESMICRMSSMLRMSLDSVGLQEVPLQQELEALNVYLEIEMMRFGDRLEVETDIAPETLDASIPNFILLPLLESIIRLKVAPSRRGSHIRLRSSGIDDRLVIEIDDNGNGWKLDPEADQQQQLLLDNTRERLKQLYGAEHQFTVRIAGESGPFVRMELPFRVFDEEQEKDE